MLTQVWIAICVYLLLSYLKFANRVAWSLTHILRLLQINLFERRSLRELLLTEHSWPPTETTQLTLVTP